MSFTAEVKDELARVGGSCPECAVAELAALVRVCGALSFHGSGAYSIRVSTETGAVARTVIRLAHEVFDLDTSLTVRRSNLHKSRNYLIEIPEQKGLEQALIRMGVLVLGRGLSSGIAARVVARPCCRAAYLRGAFMAGGFIADPRGDFHLEIAVTGDEFADDLLELLDDEGITARVNRRRGSFAIYLKSFDDIAALLGVVGAERTARAVKNIRVMKSVKNDVNRRVNAELANQARSTGASAGQLALIDRVEREIGFDALPPALMQFCVARREHPELSLRDLGAQMTPPLSKSALYHRVLRLEKLLE
ncbi:MAG: DNA-binding protein WhiA [Parolsenella sp.]|uniref:DNA-binding protein WhiA n=1 Tax=Parolsenella sp. TaxID=2083006 RepID=UPI002A758863|nr:DNA-binding protein WhiA [Parolsenella sp.]MCI5949903.1 DNA-binding protein WhiA [Coriobacteriaceae bacterium]MDY3291378.1 DNA-binding protein WhiA [Parolsenella sp.]